VFNETLGKAYLDFIAILPAIATSTPEEFSKCGEGQAFATFALLDVLPDPAKAVMALMLPFFAEQVSDIGLFTAVRKQLERNVNQVSASVGTSGKLVMPDKHKGTAREIVGAYLNNTPFESLFYAGPFNSEVQRLGLLSYARIFFI
jgi:hypothetical protein